MRPHPTTAEYIATIATRFPSSPAWWEGGDVLDYAAFHARVCQCGHMLLELGVQRGQRVAVSGPELGAEVLLLLAAESLGAVTVSFRSEDDPDVDWLFGRVDWVFSTHVQQVPASARFVHVDAAFLRALRQPSRGNVPAWAALPDDAPQRMVRTSGSSGASKFMLLSRGAQEWWIRCSLETQGAPMDPGSRYLVLSPMVVNAAFSRVSGTLRRGGLVMTGPGSDIAVMAPTHVTGLPMQFERLLRDLPAGYVAPRPVWVSSFGGPAPPDLRARVQAAFRAPLRNGYGSNETAVICEDLDASGTGAVRAGVDVVVLDDDLHAVPPGNVGRLAIRSPAVPAGYLDRPQESAAAFRDGWFLSGDAGALLGPRMLRLEGRQDDLVNLGGIKLPAMRFESALRAQPAIADAAVLAINLADGATLGVAAVLREGVTVDAGMLQVRAALRLEAGVAAKVLFVQAIPRLAEGKTDRMALLDAFRRHQSPAT